MYYSQNSLCILDELGRGTATFDGTAIAHAVVEHLVSFKHCRTLFATHYHSLVNDWELDPRVKLGHMDCIVQQDAGDVSAEKTGKGSAAPAQQKRATEEVTFLYKLSVGSSPRSSGIKVARLAGLPAAVIELAMEQSRAFEERMQNTQFAAANAASEHRQHVANSTSTVFCSKLTVDQISSVFERLTSIANSSSTIPELAFLAAEMWKRFDTIRNNAN